MENYLNAARYFFYLTIFQRNSVVFAYLKGISNQIKLIHILHIQMKKFSKLKLFGAAATSGKSLFGSSETKGKAVKRSTSQGNQIFHCKYNEG